jgi:hypothetical protein
MSTHTKALYTRIAVRWYDERREEAFKGDLSQAAKSLNSVVEYWPVKVPRDGEFGYIASSSRKSAIREIITRMRTLTGEDLGDDPQPWIQKYYKNDVASQGGADAGSSVLQTNK